MIVLITGVAGFIGSKLAQKFIDNNKANMAEDHNGSPVFLARNLWRLDKAIEENPDLQFLKTKEQLF